ncbi:MAG TPA: serpin family protein [Clostridia bacterium]|nr:serpin family protein [Clostridia bacterium]
MKKFFIISLSILVLMTALAGCGLGQGQSPGKPARAQILASPGQVQEGISYDQVSQAFQGSLWDFAGQTSASVLVDGGEGNSLYSPMSLYFALAMLEAGSAGQTKADLRHFLAASPEADIGQELSKLYALMTHEREGAVEAIANALWLREDLVGDEGAGVKKAWLDQMANQFYASAYAVDFSDKKTGQMMSDWVAEQTRGKIKPEIDISDPLLLLVLMNTVYFKADWLEPFPESNLVQEAFYGQDQVIDRVPYLRGHFMNQSVLLSDRFTAARLPLMNGNMVFVLPQEGLEVQDLLADPAFLSDLIFASWGDADLTIKLPKFSYRNKTDILKAMEDLGLSDIVQGSPNLSAMLDMSAEVSSIIQETYIALDEKGVEAAGYTEIQVRETSAMPLERDQVYLTLNRPFLYVIQDDAGNPLFVGIIRNPLAD